MSEIIFWADALRMFEVVSFFGDVVRDLKRSGRDARLVVTDQRNAFLTRWQKIPADFLDLTQPVGQEAGENIFSAGEIERIFQLPLATRRLPDRQRLQQQANATAAAVSRYLQQRRAGAIVMWGGSLPQHRIIHLLAQQKRIPILYMENGYFKNSLQIGLGGINADNPWLQMQPAKYKFPQVPFVPGPAAGPLPKRNGFFTKNAQYFWSLAFKLGNFQKKHPDVFVSNSLGSSFASILYPGWLRLLGKMTSRNRRKLPGRYYFIPFQVHDDSQIVCNSTWIKSMEDLLDAVHSAVRKHDPESAIVVKEHPVDLGRRNYRKLRKKYPDVIFSRQANLEEMIRNCQAVITINSTVGFEALQMHKPVITLGRAFYSHPGIAFSAGSEAALAALVRKREFYPDPAKVDNYVQLMRTRFVPCAWRVKDAEGTMRVAEWILSYAHDSGL